MLKRFRSNKMEIRSGIASDVEYRHMAPRKTSGIRRWTVRDAKLEIRRLERGF